MINKESLIERSPVPMAELEGPGHIIRYVNPAFCRLLGKSQMALTGKPFAATMQEKNGCLALLDRVYRTGEPETHTEAAEPVADSPYWSYAIWPVLDANARPVSVMMQVTETTQFHQQTSAMNEALLLSSVRQHELTEAAEKRSDQLGAEIVGHKRTEEALRVAEEHFRYSIEHAPIPVIMQAEDGEVLEVSKTWTELTGYTREEMKTLDGWLNRAYGHGADEVREHVRGLFAGKSSIEPTEFEIQTQQAGCRSWIFSAWPVGTLLDGRRYLVGTALDVTDRKQAEEALRVSEERFRGVFTGNMTPMGLWTKEGGIPDANDALLDLLGYSRAELTAGQIRWTELTTPEYAERDQKAVAEVEAKGACTPYEKEFIGKNGRRIPILIGGGSFHERTQTGIFFVVDLTERKQTEAQLRRWEHIFSHAGWAIAAVEPENNTLLLVNPAFAEMHGYRAEEMIGMPLAATFAPASRAEFAKHARAANELGNYIYESTHLRKNGTSFPVRTHVTAFKDENGRVIYRAASFQDLAESRKAEERLRESEENYRVIVNQGVAGIFKMDLEGNVRFANERFAEMLGYSMEEMLRLSVAEIVSQEDQTHSAKLFERFTRHGEGFEIEKRLLRKDGSLLWVNNQIAPVFGSDGSLQEAVVMSVDIADRKAAAEALRLGEERLRLATEVGRIGTCDWNYETGWMQWNEVRFRLYGLEPLERLMHLEESLAIIHPEDREEVRRAVKTGVEERGEHAEEYRVVHPDGSVHWIAETGRVAEWIDGQPLRVISVLFEITQRKEAEEALRESAERYRLLVEGTPDYAMFLLDRRNTITYWSGGAEKVFGWSAEEAIGQNGNLIFTPEDRTKKQEEKELAGVLRDGYVPDRRWHLRKDGRRIWVDGVMRRLDGSDGSLRGFAKIARDATELRTAEDELRHARDEMEQRVLERTRDLLVTNNELERTMSQRQQLEKELLEISEREKRRIGEDLHDMICQELTATALFLKATAKKVTPESASAAETLEEAAQIVNRNVGLARDLARGLQPAELKGSGLKEALRVMAAQAGESGDVNCHFKAARGVRVTDDTVALHLYRVAQEAVKNALKHSGAKNMLITLDRNSDHICVSVQDDGKGFSPKRRSKGLGLHIMRYRANALGGELKIEKRARGGMDITCVVPVEQ